MCFPTCCPFTVCLPSTAFPPNFHLPICLSYPTLRRMYRLCPKASPVSNIFFWGIVSTDSSTPSYHSFQNTVLLHPCLYPDSVGLGHHVRKQTLNSGVPSSSSPTPSHSLYPFSDAYPPKISEESRVLML